MGPHTTLTLAQIVVNLKRRSPSLAKTVAWFWPEASINRETAFIAAMLGADAIQMGTAYLATREIVETGALTALYQRLILESPPGETVVSGEETGLRVRSLRTPRTAAILSLEREFPRAAGTRPPFGRKMEEMAAGSLLVAARGLDRPGGAPLSEQACLEKGQFMSGACAGGIHKVQTVAALHQELAAGPVETASALCRGDRLHLASLHPAPG